MQTISESAISDDIDIAALLRALNYRKIWILGIAALVAIATYIALGFVTPRYYSEARVIIEHEENYYKRPADAKSPNQQTVKTDPETVASQVQVMLSRDLAMGVVKDLNLADDPEFASSASAGFISGMIKSLSGYGNVATPEARNEKVLDAFVDRLSVYQLQASRVIAIGFQSNNPETAAKVANRLSDLYLTWQQSEKLKQTKEASNWLRVQIQELTKKVEAADIAADKFRSSTGLFEGRGNTSLDAQQLSELNSQIILAKAQRTEAEARAALIQRMLKETGDVASAADVLKSTLIQRLLEQRVRVQRSLAESSVTLLPSHPRIKELNSELKDLKRQIRDEARKVVAGLQNEAQIAGAREASLRDSLKDMKVTTAKGNENQIKLRALERELTSNRELLESYLARYRDASARSAQGSVPAHASIVSRAHVSSTPSFPRKGPISMLAFAAIAFLGFAQTIARELIVPRHSYQPHMHSHHAPARHPTQQHPVAANTGEGVVTVNSPDELARCLDRPQNRNIVIMPMAGDPGAASALMPALRAIANDGKATILIDALGSGNSVARSLDLADAAGIHAIISGAAEFGDAVRRDPKSQLQIISGGIGAMLGQSFDAQRLAPISKALEAAYDHVVYLAGPDECIAVLRTPSNFDPALVLLSESSASIEDTLWQADQIFGDRVDQPPLVVLADISKKSGFRMPFRMVRKAG